MSDITENIDRYVEGDLTFDELAEFLIERDWPDPEPVDRESAFKQMLGDGPEFPVDGTFDEVTVAYYLDKLTTEEFEELAESHNALG